MRETSVSKKEIEDLAKYLKQHNKNPELNDIIATIECLDFTKKGTPNKFQQRLNEFNQSLREISKGMIVGRVLHGGGHGNRSGIYRANIGKIKLINYDMEEATPSWKEIIEERLAKLEEELEQIKAMLSSK